MKGSRPKLPGPARLLTAAILRFYPRTIRIRFGTEMMQFVAEARAEQHATRGRTGFLYWSRTLAGLLRHALAARIDDHRCRRRRRHPGREREPGRSPIPPARPAELVRDLARTARNLIRAPAFTLMTVTTLALGIGASTWIYSVVQPVLIAPLDYPEADELVLLHEQNRTVGGNREWVSPLTFRDWTERAESFEALSSWRLNLYTWTDGERPRLLRGWAVSAGYFSLLGAEMQLGRDFTAAEDEPGGERVVVIGHALWQQEFGADPQILGRTMTLDGTSYRIVGVAGPRVEYPSRGDYWVPAATDYSREFRDFRYLGVIGRLRDGVSLDEAAAEMDRIAAGIATENPATNEGWGVEIRNLKDIRLAQVRPILLALCVAVGLLLLIAVGNVTNLALARSTARRTEAAIRSALGADRGTLARMYLTESLLTAALGAGLGLLLAAGGIGLLERIAPQALPRAEGIALGASSVLVAAGLALITGLVVGLLTLLVSGRRQSGSALRSETGGRTATRGMHRFRQSILTVQVGFALALLVGAILLTRSLISLSRVDAGFAPDDVLTFSYQLPTTDYPWPDAALLFQDELLDTIEQIPGLEAAGTVTPLPMEMGSVPSSWTLPPGPGIDEARPVMAHMRVVSPGYFAAMRLPLVAGRLFETGDRQDTAPVVLVNRAFTERYLSGIEPIGIPVTAGEADDPTEERSTIVGVVGDVRFRSLRSESEPEIYIPASQFPQTWGHLVVRSDNSRSDLVEAVTAAVGRIDPALPLADIRSGEEIIDSQLRPYRLSTTLALLLAITASILAMVGIVGVFSLVVAQRMPEMGIRMALGASPGGIVRLVLGRGMKPVGVGLLLGLALAVPGTRLLTSQVYGVSRLDPLTFVLAVLLLAAAGYLACRIPGSRAASADPVELLKTE